LLEKIIVLLVLVVWSISFDDLVDSIYGAWDSISSDKIGKIPGMLAAYHEKEKLDSLV